MVESAINFAAAHDGRFLLAAALVCFAALLASFAMLARARAVQGVTRRMWFAIIGLAAGSGVWATHFVAMLAYQPGELAGFDIAGTVAAVAVAVIGATAAFVACESQHRLSWLVGGLAFGLGLAAMLYTGIASFQTSGRVTWSPAGALTSICWAVALSLPAFRLICPGVRFRSMAVAAALLTAALFGMHFIAVEAVRIVPDPDAVTAQNVLSKEGLAAGAVGVIILVLASIGAGVLINDYGTNRTLARLRRLANGTFEGLAVVRDGRIQDVNAAFLDMTGGSSAGLHGLAIEGDLLELAPATEEARREGVLRTADGNTLPVEVLVRPLSEDETVYAVRDLRERHTAEARIRFLAEHDLLTGLFNRATGRARLDGAVELAEADETIAVLRVDLDGLREINELHGLGAGDAALKAIASRLKLAVPKPSILSRPGGGEFHIVQVGDEQPAGAARLANELLLRIRAPISYAGSTLGVTASIGISLYPGDGTSAEQLLTNADSALTRAKSDGRDTFRFFQRDLDDAMRERRMLARDLREAIAGGQLRVAWQPLADTSSGAIVGFEALVRWEHPVHGFIMPDAFVPIAEENGLIGALGEWVLTVACAEAAAWRKPLKVAVNLSPLQVHEETLPDRVAAVLRATGLEPSRLELEITETALFRDTASALGNLRQLKGLGARIAIDDFGTGYSSLLTLESFPFDKLKIDKGFIENLHKTDRAAAIVRAIIGLGHSLGISIAAEGIEAQDQLEFLRAERCDEVQGYIVGKPEPIEAYADAVGLRRETSPVR
jgi:diguanylate cyclase (GGDEF)-like protein